MQYIKVANDGVLDVPVACNMLGASVKVKEEAIGMFGSGLKYALAQACRMGYDVHFASGDHVYKAETRPQEFRDKMFEKVVLRDTFSEEVHDTPITTAFGEHDWTDPWFIYREIVCNAMDEPGFRLSVVNSLRRCKSETAIFLDYEDFKKFHDNFTKYFSSDYGDWVKAGTGRVFKRGVLVGQINGIDLDFQCGNVEISESREVSEWDALYRLGYMLNGCEKPTVWEKFVQAEKRDKVGLNFSSESVTKAFNTGCRRAFGEYALCPDVTQIKNDLMTVRCHPLVIPMGWLLPEGLPTYRDKINLEGNDIIRDPNEQEEEMIEWGLSCATAFDIDSDVVIKVFTTDKKIKGLENGKEILLKESVFNDKRGFLSTLFHELGHADSGAGDYDRAFASYFIDKMVNFIVE